jgi:hypothetical protein
MRLHGSGFGRLKKSMIAAMNTAPPTITMARLVPYKGPRSLNIAAA